VLGDVEFANAEREVDRVEIFEGRRPVGKVKDAEDEGKNGGKREVSGGPPVARLNGSRRDVEAHVGRKNRPSFRLPVRYPSRSRLT
jgi:hypothetical protein